MTKSPKPIATRSKSRRKVSARKKLTRKELIAELEQELAGVQRQRIARTLAPEYIRHFGLFPEGVNLIPWLTTSRCRTNTEALVDWIEHQLEDPEVIELARETPESVQIVHRLQNLLIRVEASLPC